MAKAKKVAKEPNWFPASLDKFWIREDEGAVLIRVFDYVDGKYRSVDVELPVKKHG